MFKIEEDEENFLFYFLYSYCVNIVGGGDWKLFGESSFLNYDDGGESLGAYGGLRRRG